MHSKLKKYLEIVIRKGFSAVSINPYEANSQDLSIK